VGLVIPSESAMMLELMGQQRGGGGWAMSLGLSIVVDNGLWEEGLGWLAVDSCRQVELRRLEGGGKGVCNSEGYCRGAKELVTNSFECRSAALSAAWMAPWAAAEIHHLCETAASGLPSSPRPKAWLRGPCAGDCE